MASEGLPSAVQKSVQSEAMRSRVDRWGEYLVVEFIDGIDSPKAPFKASEGAAGYDLFSAGRYTVEPRGRQIISTGIAIHMPPGVYGRIAERSSLGANGIKVNGGVIDPDYRGEIKVILENLSNIPYSVNPGDRIAQLILEKYVSVPVKVVSKLADIFGSTERGEGGFGSTGK
jgi:dUTP pyrophosphatase